MNKRSSRSKYPVFLERVNLFGYIKTKSSGYVGVSETNLYLFGYAAKVRSQVIKHFLFSNWIRRIVKRPLEI
jgi:hypothetical protein